MKNVSENTARHSELFLTVIKENGDIKSANALMLKNFGISDPVTTDTNFFSLVHPLHRDEFKRAVRSAGSQENASDIEIYIKNGHYHPMKWQVNFLPNVQNSERTYLCLGYKIIDDDRMRRFNRLLKNNCPLVVEGMSGIIFHDKKGEMIATNQKAAAIFNTTLERLYQLTDIEMMWNTAWVIKDELGNQVLFEDAPFMTALRTEEVQKKTLCIQLLNGEERWILFHSQPLPEEESSAGQFAVVSNIVDVTDQRRMTRQLQQNEALISSFFDQTPTMAWVIDENANLLFASNAFYQQFGLKKEECIGSRVTDLIPPSISKAVATQHLGVCETGEPVHFTECFNWADGTKYISHINLFPINDFMGKRLVGGHAINIPDKTKLEKELHYAQERLLTLTRATSDAIWEWDMQTGQIFRNEVLLEMIGFQLDNSKGLSWWLRRIHPEDRNRVSDKVKEATDALQQSWQDEYRFKCADGSYKHVQDKGYVVYENGLPVKMIGSLQDVSSLKELENKLADERLLRQKELSETVISVQENERTRIGHELHDNVNQILSTAKLFMDMVVPTGADQQQIKEKSVDYLLMAIEEIRTLSRDLVAPKLKEETLTDSIRKLVEDLEMAHDMSIRFKHDLESDRLSQGKKVTLFRIVQEQLKNIIKHSKATVTDIVLQTREQHVYIVIKDNGTGFDPHQTRQGIGLTNITERAQFYNGSVDIQAAKGEGCVLSVSIPVED